jgi:hypothetical protein
VLASVCASTGREAEAVTLLEEPAALGDRSLPAILSLQTDSARTAAWRGSHFYFELYLALVAEHLADSPEAVGKALDLILRRKSLWVELLASSRKDLLEAQYPTERARIEEMYFLRRQAATKRWSGPRTEALKSHERLLAEWEERANRLEAELAERIPELEIRRRLATLDRWAVADALPSGGALIEFVRLPVWDFRALFTQAEPAAPSARYLAFVLSAGQPEAVRLIDLGPAEAIDRLVAEHRAALFRADRAEALATQQNAVLGGRYPALAGLLRRLTALRSEVTHKTLAGAFNTR